MIEIICAETVGEDVLNCLSTLYGTPVGTCGLERDFGINFDIVDMPLAAAGGLLSAEIIRKTRKYEPRVSVSKVDIKMNNITGKIDADVRISVNKAVKK